MDDGFALRIGLTQPETGGGEVDPTGLAPEIAVFLFHEFGDQDRGKRIDNRDLDDAEAETDHQCRQQELPGRNPGGAGDDQLLTAGQLPERVHGAEQDGERDDLLADLGQFQQAHLQNGKDVQFRLLRGPPEQLKGIEQQHNAEQHTEHQRHVTGKGTTDIAVQGERQFVQHGLTLPLWGIGRARAKRC